MLYFVVLSFILVGVRAASCPNLKPITNFNSTAYIQGTWYEVGRYYNNWENKGDCVELQHKTVGDKITFLITYVVNNKQRTVDGDIKLDSREGYIDYYARAYKASESTDTLAAEILSIDYDKYAIVYFCAMNKGTLHVYSWILSRTKKMDDATMATVKKLYDSTKFLDINKMIWDHFDDKICEVH